ncbi:hypothetical protein [Aureimonas sp. AU40]|uniref:hypothetical protein n=1 Tax=Aureimonas sp. AU40 TaxID=1637747 RepID=UPI000781DBA7|nr:hypothetical protein [Aureimonas sp. AU40]
MNLTGAAGEHYVMSQLLRRDFIAALAPVGVPNTDIVVTDAVGDRLASLQVKSRRELGGDGGWHMGKKHEAIVGELLFYCFVDFGVDLKAHPRCWVLPSAVVAETIRESYRVWLSTPGKGGRMRNSTDHRRFLPNFDRTGISIERGAGWLDPYEDNWEQLRGVV